MRRYSPAINPRLSVTTAPLIEPVTLAEVKEHLRLDTGAISDNLTTHQSISPGTYTPGDETGTGVDVLGSQVLVNLNAGAFVAGATLDAKLQESDDDITYADVQDGAFTQVTDATDDQIFELEYTGDKQYLRVFATVATANATFSADIILSEPESTEDNLLSTYITVARNYVEKIAGRALISRTYSLYLDRWPVLNQFNECLERSPRIPLLYSPVQSVTSITYYDVDDTGTLWASTNYELNNVADCEADIVLRNSASWPTTTLRNRNGIKIIYVAGYGDDRSDVPEVFKLAIKMIVGHFYEHREATQEGQLPKYIELGVHALLDLNSGNLI